MLPSGSLAIVLGMFTPILLVVNFFIFKMTNQIRLKSSQFSILTQLSLLTLDADRNRQRRV